MTMYDSQILTKYGTNMEQLFHKHSMDNSLISNLDITVGISYL